MSKSDVCNNQKVMFKSFDALSEMMGKNFVMNYNYTIHSIELAADKKSASVDISYEMGVEGVMNIHSRNTEIIINKLGKPLMSRSEGNAELAGSR